MPRVRLKDLDLRGNAGVRELPASLLTSTPLAKLLLDDAMLGKDGLLKEMAGSEEYLKKRKARIDKELHGKLDGGEVRLSG